MNDQDWVERFGADIDHLFKNGTLAHSIERTPAEYSELLALAQTLSSIDFSDQSQIQQALRRRLLTRMDTREGWHLQGKIPMLTLFRKRRFALVLPTVILVGLLIITSLAWPGGLTAAAQDALDFVQRLWIGEHTSIEPIDPEQIIELDDGRLMMQGGPVDESKVVEGNPVQGGEEWVEIIEVRQFGTIAEAQTAVSFTLRQPGYLPEGYAFGRAKVWGDGHFAFANLHYDGPAGEIMLGQRLVGGQPGQTVSIGLPSDYVIETVQVNGHTAAWAEHVLLWEANGISYLLSSPDLSLAEATRIAESLE